MEQDDFIIKSINKVEEVATKNNEQIGTDLKFKRKIVWFNVYGFTIFHILGLIGLFGWFTGIADIRTTLFGLFLGYAGSFGITMGAHRLWCHRAYKAKRWLQFILLLCQTLATQNCLHTWVRDHRQHHKYSDTDADPHNATRGFFFSHIGWLMSRKHPKVIEYGKNIDMSDLEADPWIMFQKKYYGRIYIICSIIIPTLIPIIFWKETTLLSILAFFARNIIFLNFTWSLNSAAHRFGTKPYDKTIYPTQCKLVALITIGEGWHNFHHAFPWDYRASELGTPINPTGYLIDILAKYGIIYDLRSASEDIIKLRVQKRGDGTYNTFKTFCLKWTNPIKFVYNLYFIDNKTL